MHTKCKIKLLVDKHNTILLVTRHLSGCHMWVPKAFSATSFASFWLGFPNPHMHSCTSFHLQDGDRWEAPWGKQLSSGHCCIPRDKDTPGSEKEFINVHGMIVFCCTEHACSRHPEYDPFTQFWEGRAGWSPGLLILKPPAVFTELRVRVAPNVLEQESSEARNGVPPAGRCGTKTTGFGDWLVPALTLAALHKLIHHFKTCFPPLLEVGITDAAPMVVIIEMNDHLVAHSSRMSVCCLV